MFKILSTIVIPAAQMKTVKQRLLIAGLGLTAFTTALTTANESFVKAEFPPLCKVEAWSALATLKSMRDLGVDVAGVTVLVTKVGA